MKDVQVLEYGIEYPVINLKLKKDKPKMYDLIILHLYNLELKKGFKVKKINKTTRKGTKVTYIALKDEEDLKEYIKFMDEKAKEIKEKYMNEGALDER